MAKLYGWIRCFSVWGLHLVFYSGRLAGQKHYPYTLKCPKSDPSLNNISSVPPFITFRHSRKLKDRLVHSDTRKKHLTLSSGCLINPSTYRLFPLLRQILYFTLTSTKYTIKSLINSSSTQVVYMIKCSYGVVYAGQTKRALKIYISEHKTTLNTQNIWTDYAITLHYAQVNHDYAVSLKFWRIEETSPSPRGGDIINSDMSLQRDIGFTLLTQWSLLAQMKNWICHVSSDWCRTCTFCFSIFVTSRYICVCLFLMWLQCMGCDTWALAMATTTPGSILQKFVFF